MNVHIVSHIQQVIDLKEVSVSSFAKAINKIRTVVYPIFTRESVDSKLLYEISKALDYNFFELYFPAEPTPLLVEESNSDYQESFKMKYYALQEKHNKLLEKMVKRK